MKAPASTGLLPRAVLALYPPSWRVRYGDEVRGPRSAGAKHS